MGNDWTMGGIDCCGTGGHYDKINTVKSKDHIKTKLMVKIDQQLDRYTSKMLEKKIREIMNLKAGGFPDIQFPAPYKIQTDEKYDIQTIEISCCSKGQNIIYKLPVIDEYYGDLNHVHKYHKYNNYQVNDKPSEKNFDSIDQANDWFDDMIYKPLYTDDNRQKLKYKLFNEWADINIQNILNKNQIVMTLFGSNEFTGSDEDIWLTFIAFSGFAAHRTDPMTPTDEHPGSYFKNDTTFLSGYRVRTGYKKYGAIAYFDSKYRIIKIFLSHNKKTYTPNSYIKSEWEHAKWVWKVSVTVATFLVDMVAHCRFREATGFIKAIQSKLNIDHPIRRLLLPFTFGTVYSNRVLNEYLKENGLFHRAFGFKYNELSRLISSAMSDAPSLHQRSADDSNKYIFRLLRKKVGIFKKLPSEVYPLYEDVYKFWTRTLDFVSEYVRQYYNDDDQDDSQLVADDELKLFYEELLDVCNIGSKYRLKKFNIINILTHFICNSTVWHSHLSSAVSFDYFMDPKFTGLKIVDGAMGNSIQSYAEYCSVVLCKGWGLMSFDGKTNNIMKGLDFGYSLGTMWSKVLLQDDKLLENKKIFKEYFIDNMKSMTNEIDGAGTVVPYHEINPKYFGSSIML